MTKRWLFVLLALLAALRAPALRAHTTVAPRDAERMSWWREARFGMFIHWGIYAVAAGEWNGQAVPGIGEWIMYHGQIPRQEYETLAQRFNPVEFNADEWVRIARDAGMKYLVITSKHHDGFCMFDSAQTKYDIIDATPFGRDPLRELVEACRKEGLPIGFYHSIMDWHHPDANQDRFPRYVEYLRAQIRELLTNYGPIDILWLDGEWIEEWTPELGEELYKLCRELQPNIIVNNRVGKGRAGMEDAGRTIGDFGTPEQTIPGRALAGQDWETCMTMNDTWGFKRSDQNWKSAEQLIRNLIEAASKGGNYLLNVGPTPEGLIPPQSVERLAAMGRWLEVNGESIYGSTAGPPLRLRGGFCTAKPGRLFLHVFDRPASGVVEVEGLRNTVIRATSPSVTGQLAIQRSGERLLVRLPATPAPFDAGPLVIALEIVGQPVVVVPPLREDSAGSVVLGAVDADLASRTARLETIDGIASIEFWTDRADAASWEFEIARPGEFTLELVLACQPEAAGSELAITVGDQALRGIVPDTGSWSQFIVYPAGRIAFASAGRHVLRIAPRERFSGALMNLREIRLTRDFRARPR